MVRSSGPAAATHQVTPQSAETFPTLEFLADAEEPLPAPLRERIRSIVAGPVAQLRHEFDLVETASRGPDPEFALFRLREVLQGLLPVMHHLEAQLARAVGPLPPT